LPSDGVCQWTPSKRTIGYDDGREEYTFLVCDVRGRAVTIRHRPLTGDTFSTQGCSVGLLGAEQLKDAARNAAVVVVEGESDWVALRHHFRQADVDAVVVAVPGAGVFKAEWADWFGGRSVVLCYDRDLAGRQGEQKAFARVSAKAASVRCVHWPKAVFVGDGKGRLVRKRLAKGFDIRDWLTVLRKSWRDLQAYLQPTPRLGEPVEAESTDTDTADLPEFDRRIIACATPRDAVVLLNERHFIIRVGSSYVVGEERDGQPLRLLPYDEFKKRYMSHGFSIDGKWTQLGTLYLRDTRHRFYDGELVCRPPGCRESAGPDDYNLWRQLAVKPRRGDWSLLQEHLFVNLCRKKQEHYDYLRKWMALAAQQPGRLPGVAVVLIGLEGTGKTAFYHWFGALFPPEHRVQITNKRHLVGHFNALLSGRVLVFADEAFFAGDRDATGALHGLITEPRRVIERKGIDPWEEDSCVHLMIASNHDWVVHASRVARRYFVLKVSDARMQDTAYFTRITKQQREEGGREAMLHDLLAEDLSDFNPYDFPRTEGLREQMDWSLLPHEAWWKEKLMEATADSWQSTSNISKSQLHLQYTEWMRKMQRGYPITLIQLSKYFTRLYGKAVLARPRTDGRQHRVYAFPSLPEARERFDSAERWPVESPRIVRLRRKDV
jgi:hypothetical protein